MSQTRTLAWLFAPNKPPVPVDVAVPKPPNPPAVAVLVVAVLPNKEGFVLAPNREVPWVCVVPNKPPPAVLVAPNVAEKIHGRERVNTRFHLRYGNFIPII